MATPVILVTGHEGTAAVTADLHRSRHCDTSVSGTRIRAASRSPPTVSPPRTTTTTPGIHEIRHPSRPPPPSSSTVPGPPPRPSCTGNDCHYDGRAAERAGRKEMGCVGQRGTRGHRRACTRQIHPHRRPCRPAFVPGQPRGRRRDRRRGAGDLQRRRVRPVGRPGVGRPSWCPGGRCLLAARRRGRRRRAQRTRLLRPQCRQGGRGNDRRPVGGPRPVQFRELSSERRRVQPRRRRNRNFRTRDRHHLSRRRGHRDRTRRALPAGGSRPEKSNPGYLHRGQRKRQRPHPGRYGGRARHDRRP